MKITRCCMITTRCNRVFQSIISCSTDDDDNDGSKLSDVHGDDNDGNDDNDVNTSVDNQFFIDGDSYSDGVPLMLTYSQND